MKKNILLLLGLLCSQIILASASTSDITSPSFDKTHTAQTICEDQSKPTFQTTNTGDEYLWYKLEESSNTYKYFVSYRGDNKYTPTRKGKYLCKVYKNGSTTSTGNILSAGTFNFQCNDMTRYDGNDGIYVKDGITYRFKNLKCNANDGTYPGGFTCIKDKSTNVKPTYFQFVESRVNGNYDGTNILVCDGMNSSNFRVWEASGVAVLAGEQYKFTCSIANIDKEYNKPTHGSASLPLLKFFIEYSNGTKEEILDFEAPRVVSDNNWRDWEKTFTPSRTDNNCKIYIQNYTTCDEGNDFALDNITFGTTLSTSGTEKLESFELKIDTKPAIAMPVIADQCPNTSVSITPTVTNAGSTPTYTWTGDSNERTKDISITSASTVGDSKTCKLEVTNGQCNSSETITITTKDCGREESIPHNPITVCTEVKVKLRCDKTGSTVKWDHDATLTNTEIEVTSNSQIDKEDTYKCTITTTENGNTVTYVETFSVKTQKCESLKETTICNTTRDSVLTTQATGDLYKWTLADGSTIQTTQNIQTVDNENNAVGTKLTYQCVVLQSSKRVATETFEITVTNCQTEGTQTHQVKEDGSITLEVPEDKRCGTCTYKWYKKTNDGAIADILQESNDYTYTIPNATEDKIYCEVIDIQNRIVHTEEITIVTFKPEPEPICYDSHSSSAENTKEIVGAISETNKYEWYWLKDDVEILFPDEAITIDGNIATLNLEYFVNQSNSTDPIEVNVIQKYEVKIENQSTTLPDNEEVEEEEAEGPEETENTEDTETDTETETETETEVIPNDTTSEDSTTDVSTTEETTSDDSTTEDDEIVEDTQETPQITYINLKLDNITDITALKTNNEIEFISENNTSNTNPVVTTFKISNTHAYTPGLTGDLNGFPSKYGGMVNHNGYIRITDTALNGGKAYTIDDPNNIYFMEIDGGDTAGAVFSIAAKGKVIKSGLYILSFLAKNTNNNTTDSPAEIDFTISLNGNEYNIIPNHLFINHGDWTRYTFRYIADEDADEAIITLNNYNTSSGQNDFGIDEITFELSSLLTGGVVPAESTLSSRSSVEYQMWRKEFPITINQTTSQEVVESASPKVKHESEVKLTYNNKNESVTFTFDPEDHAFQGTTTYKTINYEYSNIYGCTHYVYFTLNLVEIKPDIFFTPNGDGVHDKWMVEGIETAPDAHIMIYDRHSKLLYKSVASEFDGWDGTYNGHGMVQDDYWYVIQVPETGETLSGHFILKR